MFATMRCGPRPRRISEPSADPEDLELLSPDEREKRRSFEAKRKKHYNEFQAVKMARQLMAEDEDDDEENSRDDIIDQSGAAGGEKSKQSDESLPMEVESRD